MFVTIDRFILERIFTPFAWWFERQTGRTNLFLAWWSTALCILALVFMADIEFVILHDDNPVIIIVYSVFVVLVMTTLLLQGPSKHAAIPGMSTKVLDFFCALAPVARVGCLFILVTFDSLRCLVLFPKVGFSPMTWVAVAQVLFDLLFLIGWYFGSVRRPPPAPRKYEAKHLSLAPVAGTR